MDADAIRILGYQSEDFPFAALARAALGVEDLGLLHLRADLRRCDWPTAMKRCRSELAQAFDTFASSYDAFAVSLARRLGFALAPTYQRPPTFRVHLVGARTASSPHRDRDYARGLRFVNAWVPLVDVRGSNSLWVESGPDGALAPVAVRYGEVLVFNGYDMVHGSVENTAATTRVSFDMRYYVDNVPIAR